MAEEKDLSQEMEAWKKEMEEMMKTQMENFQRAQMENFQKMISEALNKEGKHGGTSDRVTIGTDRNPMEADDPRFPPKFEHHHNNPEWDQGWWHGPYFGTTEGAYKNPEDRLKEELEEKMQLTLKEQLKTLKGPSSYGPIGIKELCLTPNVVIPKDFKMPEFVKFNGSTNPLMHLKMYCTKMGIWSQDEKFLISLFSESLDGPAWEWYMQMDQSYIKCWEDLADAFVNQYKFNLNTAPSRDELKGLKKKEKESFKDYAQRWRAMAARVIPPMLESEMCSYFIRTLEGPFFTNMLGTHVKEFADLVEIGERIEANIREGKLEVAPMEDSYFKKGQSQRKKDGVVNMVQPSSSFHQGKNLTYQTQQNIPFQPTRHRQPIPCAPQPYQVNNIPPPRPYIPTRPLVNRQPFLNYQPQSSPAQMPSRPLHPGPSRPRENRPFPDFHMTKSELFHQLRGGNMISPIHANPIQPPYPRWYNANVACEYHSDVPGHSIEDCYAFKEAVWKLLDTNAIKIQEEPRPNINSNPLPNHAGGQVNGIDCHCLENVGIENTKFTMKEVLMVLKAAGYELVIDSKKEGQEGRVEEWSVTSEARYCEFHKEKMDHDIEECTQFKALVHKMQKLGLLQAEKKVGCEKREVNMVRSEPMVFKVPAQSAQSKDQELEFKKPAMVFKVPTPFPYTDNHAVPWQYKPTVESSSESMPNHDGIDTVTNIAKPGGVTRSGRCYQPPEIELQKQVVQAKPLEKSKNNEDVEGDEEFLKVMKQSEYDVVDQLRKTPAKISLLSLIMVSEAHRNSLKKILEQSYVQQDITPEKVGHIISAIKAMNTITFSEDEVAPSTSGRPKALHITLKCLGYVVAKVLIDGGSALNILPHSTLLQLPLDPMTIEPSDMVVRAFDGSKREIMGNITLQLEIGPNIFTTKFQVMDIMPAYTMLLGRPWIHGAGAVPSTLHQRVKYVVDGKLITVKGEEEMLLTKPVSVPYVESMEQAIESSLQSLEIERNEEKGEKPKCANQVVTRMLQKNGYQEGKGLGANLQGIHSPVILNHNLGTTGLGYQPTLEASAGRSEKKIPHIKETFLSSTDVVMSNPIAVTDAANALEDKKERQNWIHPCHDEEEMDNWESESLPDVMYFE